MKVEIQPGFSFLTFFVFLALAVVAVVIVPSPAHAQAFTVLYNFGEPASGYDASTNVIFDPSGNLYSTTDLGGANPSDDFGTVFELSPDGTETILHNFIYTPDGSDGVNPAAGLVRDSAGNLYGTTSLGGTSDEGAIFKIDSAGNETILHNFAGGTTDGAYPGPGNLIIGSARNLYGTTTLGGAFGFGTAYELSPGGTLTVLYSFTGGDDGGSPESGLVMDSSGNLYGTTLNGGKSQSNCGCGVVFRLSPHGSGGWQETVLHSFSGGTDGQFPYAGLALNQNRLFGSTGRGGAGNCGVVFEVGTNGNERVLYSFSSQGSEDGCYPTGVLPVEGVLYGTTALGGAFGQGSIFALNASGTVTLLHSFDSSTDGSGPNGLARGPKGLYGTTPLGGTNNQGTVFKIAP